MRHQAELCDFDREDKQIRDQIIEKCRSHQLRMSFLEKGKDPTLDQLCAIAQTLEMSESQATTIEHNPSAVTDKGCYRCGKVGHLVETSHVLLVVKSVRRAE